MTCRAVLSVSTTFYIKYYKKYTHTCCNEFDTDQYHTSYVHMCAHTHLKFVAQLLTSPVWVARLFSDEGGEVHVLGEHVGHRAGVGDVALGVQPLCNFHRLLGIDPQLA